MPLLLTWLLACGDGDLMLRDTFDTANKPDPTYTIDTDTTTDPGAQDCRWAGTWEFSGAKCGEDNFSNWKALYDTSTLVFAHNKEKGCDVILTLANEACAETTTWWTQPPEDGSTQIKIGRPPQNGAPFGVTACEPEACQFGGASSPACELGDHQADQIVLVDESKPDALTLQFFAAYAITSCDDALRLTFTKTP